MPVIERIPALVLRRVEALQRALHIILPFPEIGGGRGDQQRVPLSEEHIPHGPAVHRPNHAAAGDAVVASPGLEPHGATVDLPVTADPSGPAQHPPPFPALHADDHDIVREGNEALPLKTDSVQRVAHLRHGGVHRQAAPVVLNAAFRLKAAHVPPGQVVHQIGDGPFGMAVRPELQHEIAQGLVGPLSLRGAHKRRFRQVLGLLNPALPDQRSQPRQLFPGIRVDPVNESAGPYGVVVQLKAVHKRAAKAHPPHGSVSQRQRFVPIRSRFFIPQSVHTPFLPVLRLFAGPCVGIPIYHREKPEP